DGARVHRGGRGRACRTPPGAAALAARGGLSAWSQVQEASQRKSNRAGADRACLDAWDRDDAAKRLQQAQCTLPNAAVATRLGQVRILTRDRGGPRGRQREIERRHGYAGAPASAGGLGGPFEAREDANGTSR